MRFEGDKVALRQVFSPSTSVFPRHYYSRNAPNSFSFTAALTSTKGKSWETSKQQRSFVNRGPLDGKVLSLFYESDSERSVEP
jgi:hypothetical protein